MTTPDPATTADQLEPLREFIATATRIVERALSEADTVAEVRQALKRLIERDDWLPHASAQPHPQHYQQHLLHCDPLERFSVVSFVWGPGQRTPVHDHEVWGLIGMLRGAMSDQVKKHVTASLDKDYTAMDVRELEGRISGMLPS